MSNCLNPTCGKELVHKEGRRKKKFCDADCKNAYWRGVKTIPQYVQKETFDAVVKERDELKDGFIGLIPAIQAGGNALPVDTSKFTIEDFKKTVYDHLEYFKSIVAQNNPIIAPETKKTAKEQPPTKRGDPVAEKQANEALADVLDKPDISNLITRAEFYKLRWQDQASYKIKHGKNWKP